MEMETWLEKAVGKMAQPDGKQDQENGAGAEKNENGGNSSAGQNTDEEAAENDSSTGESENDDQENGATSLGLGQRIPAVNLQSFRATFFIESCGDECL